MKAGDFPGLTLTFGLASPLSWILDPEVLSREGGLGGQGEENAQQAAGVRRGFPQQREGESQGGEAIGSWKFGRSFCSWV